MELMRVSVVIAVAVSARLRLERCLFTGDAQPQFFHHPVQYVVVRITQPAGTELQSDVAITEVIGGAGQQ